MKPVRQWMIKPFKKNLPSRNLLLLLPILGAISACNPTELTGTGAQKSAVTNTDGSLTNKAYIYPDNPYILGGPNVSATNPNMGSYLARTPAEITTETTLSKKCSMTFSSPRFGTTVKENENCITAYKDETQSVPVARKSDQTYIFPANSPEFYQVNTLYHLSIATSGFLNKLAYAYQTIWSKSSSIPKSLPIYLKDSNLFWFKALSNTDNKLFQKSYLSAYSQCDFQNNAMFSPIGPSLCFGYAPSIPGFQFVQDPTVMYHELGHAFVSIMMNMRNGKSSLSYHPFRSNLGSYGYDEAGAINEGIADYFSFIMNKRETMGEFALGKTFNQSRPLSEASSMHISGISETSEGRLSYPQYLNYDPNEPDEVKEGLHYAGGTTSHYLVALTKQFKDVCGYSSEADGGHERSTTLVTLLLAETLSELGDLNALGVDLTDGTLRPDVGTYFNNLDPASSYLWSQSLNQTTYRRFYQVFAKNINKYVTPSECPLFNRTVSEKLLDDYGLLLFKTYNDNGNSTTSRAVTYKNVSAAYPTTLTAVSEDNRRKTVLVSKTLLELTMPTTEKPSRTTYYLIDGATEMNEALKDLLFKGFTVPISTNVASTAYNNKNLKISPGEIVSVIPNLLNKSNSTMAGVQLLATDWDHVSTNTTTGETKPCVVDDVTTTAQGAVDNEDCKRIATKYERLISKSGVYSADSVAPVCLVQLEDSTSTRWVSQNEFRKKQGLSLQDKDCLGYMAPANSDSDLTLNTHECLARFLPGANDAFFSKIEPQKSYSETIFPNGENIIFNSGNALIMEVNKWVPPGTKFRCRLRARFSNCSDCHTDTDFSNDDYLDYELNGAKPFKVINFDFEVND